MKNKFLFTIAIFIEIYNIYYFCMRKTAGILTYLDKMLCIIVGIICIIIICLYLYNKKTSNKCDLVNKKSRK